METIRRITKGEWALYREMRLASLRDAPEYFSTTYQAAVQRSPESWAAQADASAEGTARFTFLAFVDEAPAGLGALYRDADGLKCGEIIQVWAAPAFRGGGLAGRLLEFIFQCARHNGFDKIRAEVMASNKRALRFYEKQGFAIDGSPSLHAQGSIVLSKPVWS